MKIQPYIFFDGTCEQALNYYAKVLNGKIDNLMRFAGSFAEKQVPPEQGNRILHGSITIGDQVILASDAPPGHFQKPQGFSLTIQLTDTAEADRVFAALADKGTMTLPIGKTPWARRYGMCTDQFGIPWMVNCP